MKKQVKILGAIVIVVVVAAIIGANYYHSSEQSVRITNSNSGGNSTNNAVNAETLVRPDSPTLGAADAPVTIVEFLDPNVNRVRRLVRSSTAAWRLRAA